MSKRSSDVAYPISPSNDKRLRTREPQDNDRGALPADWKRFLSLPAEKDVEAKDKSWVPHRE